MVDTKLKYSFDLGINGDIISAYASINKALEVLNWTQKHSLD
jgi:hypothetical protein